MRWLNKNRIAGSLVMALLGMGGMDATLAQALPERIALPEFLEIVQRNNLLLQAERMQIDSAYADLESASAFPNPVVGHSKKPEEKETVLEQPIPIFGQRGLRMQGARLEIDAAIARVEASRAVGLHEAAQDFIALLIAQEKYAQYQRTEAQMESARHIVLGQVEAGGRSHYDKSRIEIERANAQMQVAQARAAVDDALARVAAAAGTSDWRPVALGTLQPSRELAAFDTLWEQAQRRIPSIRAAMTEQTLAEKMIEVEKREAWPVPTVGVGRLRDSQGHHSVLGVSVEIPLFDRRQGQIAKARAQSREAGLRREAVIRSARNELQRATALFSQRLALAHRFHDEGLALLPELSRMAQDAYTLGQGGILELIDAIQSIAEKQIAYLELMEGVLLAELDVRFAAGEILQSPPPPASAASLHDNGEDKPGEAQSRPSW